MSVESRTWDPSDALDDRLGEPDTLRLPEKWTFSESWQRAQTERDRGGPLNGAERMGYLDGSDSPHRVTFALAGQTLRAGCACASGRFRGWCAHLASCWWRWVRGRLNVRHLDTGRVYRTLPGWLRLDAREDADLSGLTAAELGHSGGSKEVARGHARQRHTLWPPQGGVGLNCPSRSSLRVHA